MHHKRKRTTRREVKRYDHKSARAKERTALDGGHPGQARGMSWSNTIPQPPIIDEVGLHKGKKKKQRPAKERCPVNRTHEWYREWQTIEKVHVSGRPGYWNCQDCRKLRQSGPYWFENFCPEHIVQTRYEVHARTDTCIHCWKVKVIKTEPSLWRLSKRKRPYLPRQAYRKAKR